MHSLSEFGANVPAFLAKLWKLVDDPETSELISWTEEGTSFYIRDQAQFSRKLLPMYYKHNNMASFIRQLNMYGFHKIVSADAGSLRLDKDEMEFAHQYFLRGCPYLLEHIKRKVGKSQVLSGKLEEGKDGSNGVMVKAEFMNKLLSEVKHMRGRQDSVENRLSTMKQENEALWRELSLLRQKHLKQQTIVNKLIQFLVTLVQPSQRLSKRRYPLMINNVSHTSGKSNGKVVNTNDVSLWALLPKSLCNSQSMSLSPSGPTIHELDADSLLPDGDSTLPETDLDPSSNIITLHVPGSELEEVIDTNTDPEVLDSLDPSIIASSLVDPSTSVPLMEVNSEQLAGADLQANSPSPELISVAPSELTPAVVVPGLHSKQAKLTSLVNSRIPAQKVVTRSVAGASTGVGPSKSVVTRRNTSGAKGAPVQSKETALKKEPTEPQSSVKKELRVLPPRNRKRKPTNSKELSFSSESVPVNNEPVDLLAEVGLIDPRSPSTSSLTSVAPNNDSTNDSMRGCVTSPGPCHLVAYPESPIPVIHSPVASPSSHCSIPPVAMTSLSGPTITDVTCPLVPQSPSNLPQEQHSPQPSPIANLNSPNDMTLACTSQGASSPVNSTAYKSSPFNRCAINTKEDLDLHLGSMDAELVQLKDFLNNSGIQLDANTLLGLFSGEEQLLPDGDGSNFNSKMDTTGNELMYYQPDFMDLEDIWNNENGRATPPPSPGDILSSEVNTPVGMPSSPGFAGPTYKRRRT
ncbi:hypothetical protein ONE63_010897 [Megalurothrips usitatus]|uniref:HSF-type DNA-binding domain-containing protein n=1 Tax=Megalurothrips usitatus TaxID=439358 RepID=A0AAV7XEG2_9NEOP|nr:hypothetical protein ONE63_010897 [Megalurothrips usitatus]